MNEAHRFAFLRRWLIVVCLGVAPAPAVGDTGTWTGAAGGTWNTTATNWSNVTGTPWDVINGGTNAAVFNTLGTTSTVTGTVYVNAINFSTSGTVSGLTLSGGTVLLAGSVPTITTSANVTVGSTLSGSAGLVKAGTSTLILTGSNTYIGGATISFGTLQVGAAGVSGNLGDGAVANNGALLFNRTDSVTVANTISGTGRFIIASGTVTLSGGNTYTGATSFNSSSTLRVSSLNSVSGGVASSSLGAPTTAASGTITFAGGNTIVSGIIYTGTGESTDRGIAITTGGAGSTTTLDHSGTGLLKFTGDIVRNAAATNTVVLQGSTAGTGEISGNLRSPTGILALTKQGTGTWKLSGTNTYTGATTMNAGVLEVTTLANGGVASGIGQSSNAATGLIFGAPAAVLRYSGTANVTTDRGFTLSSGAGGGATIESSGAGTLSFNNTVAIASGTTNQTRVLTLGGTNTGNNMFSKVITNNGTGATSLTKAGSGVWILDGANTFSGTVTIGAGVLSVASIGNSGATGPLGTSGTIALGTSTTVGTLRYSGAGETSNRIFTLSGTTGSGGVIEANGSSALVLTGSVTAAAGNKTLTLAGSNTGSNSIGAINNAPLSGGVTSFVKTGAGRWVLTGSGNYTGSTTIEQGELLLAVDARSTINGALGSDNNAAITIGSAAGSGTAALLLQQGVTVDSRAFTIPGGSQATVIGLIDGSGTATFGFTGTPSITLGRNATLQAATGGTLIFDNQWVEASGTRVSVTIGGVGNEGTVVLGQPLAATGTVRIDGGVLNLAPASNPAFAGSLAAASAIVVGPAGTTSAILSVRDLTSGTYAFGATQTLSGIGTIRLDADTPVRVAGFFSPGNSPGIFTFDGAGTTTLAGTTLMEITGTTAGISYDQVDFINGAILNYGSGILRIDLAGTYADNTEFKLFDFATTASGSFTTISGSGSYGSLSFVRGVGGVWTSGPTTQPSQSLEFREATGTLVVVPEPATLALAAVGIALGGWAAVRRRK